MFGGCTESVMKWLARYGLLANRMPCPAQPQCQDPNPPGDMSLIKDTGYHDGFYVKYNTLNNESQLMKHK